MEFSLILKEKTRLDMGHIKDIKDPCPVFDGALWHVYGSLCDSRADVWKIFHSTAKELDTEWNVEEPAQLFGVSQGRIAAPGVVYDFTDKLFHMFVQSDFMEVDTVVYHLTSEDGHKFVLEDIALKAELNTSEASIYDPHPAIINNKKYISYSGGAKVGRPDICLAESETNTWAGPWKKLGVILSHHEVSHHNQLEHEDYEWGLEGSQLIELPNKKVLLNAVCFLPEGKRGTRQRVFFATADNVSGPFQTLGPVIETPSDGWDSGENGHATGVIADDSLVLFYQARSKPEKKSQWRCGLRRFPLKSICQ
jgi:hypothetical protein